MRTEIAAIILALSAAGGANAQSAERGRQLFRTCTACHSPVAEESLGPDLRGVFGRKAGSVAKFSYSPALKASRIVWNEKTLAQFIRNPQQFMKGNKMYFPGYADPASVAAVIAYLKTYK
jgi:cytochrome c